ncbi:hypothetical protein [Parafrankia sp. FMc2]|uniref:hypothetical protein n=1 Tax=Parafrankia sp. FMc2 TaxID=3233196 RepID=UPI0034D681FD
MSGPRAPRDLDGHGRSLWVRITSWLDERNLILDPHEELLVVEMCRTADRLAALRRTLAVVRSPTNPDWTRLASEERQQRLAYGLLVSALGLPSGAVDDVPPAVAGAGRAVERAPRSRREQKAAATRRADADRWGMVLLWRRPDVDELFVRLRRRVGELRVTRFAALPVNEPAVPDPAAVARGRRMGELVTQLRQLGPLPPQAELVEHRRPRTRPDDPAGAMPAAE